MSYVMRQAGIRERSRRIPLNGGVKVAIVFLAVVALAWLTDWDAAGDQQHFAVILIAAIDVFGWLAWIFG